MKILGYIIALSYIYTSAAAVSVPVGAKNVFIVEGVDRGNWGTGYIMDNNGAKVIMSAGHVCIGNSKVKINKVIHKINLIRDDILDYCVIEYKDHLKGYNTFRPQLKMTDNTLYHAEGYNRDKKDKIELSTYSGIIEGIAHQDRYNIMSSCDPGVRCTSIRYLPPGVLISMAVKPGNSGGPVYDLHMNAIGVIIQTRGNSGVFTPMSIIFQDIQNKLKGVDIFPIDHEGDLAQIRLEAEQFCGPSVKPLIGFIGFREYNIFCKGE